MLISETLSGLTLEGCRQRQIRLLSVLQARKLDAALIVDPQHVAYLTGYWQRPVYRPVFFIEAHGRTTLVAPLSPELPVLADHIEVFNSHYIGTLIDDQLQTAVRALSSRLASVKALGSDLPVIQSSSPVASLMDNLLTLRRSKWPDEILLIQHAIRAAEAAYSLAQEKIHYNQVEDEISLVAEMHAAAMRSAGELIGDFGNDFQIGAIGSMPRRRKPEKGETAILDLSVTFRGYRCDLCRTYVVGGEPNESQASAQSVILNVLSRLEEQLRPGVSGQFLYKTAVELLQHPGWTFPHHLGHGVGLNPHERPRLNPHWDDNLQVGDVLTMEPGLYGSDLRAGIRIEDMYQITETGFSRLNQLPRKGY